LWDGKLQGANGGLESSWFESVGVAITLDAALARVAPNVILALDEHVAFMRIWQMFARPSPRPSAKRVLRIWSWMVSLVCSFMVFVILA
jgi:hypothetical protein